MTKKHTRLAAALKAKAPPRRSDLHKWLLARHRELAPIINARAQDWKAIAAEVAAEGMVGANGRPASPDALRKMWLRVDRDVEREQADRIAVRVKRKPPNRSPSRPVGWQTPLAATHPTPSVSTPGSPRSSPLSGTPAPPSHTPRPPVANQKSKLNLEDLPLHVREQFEKLDRGLAEFDRKRFG